MPSGLPSSMRRDVASAYLASAAKIGSWMTISALVFRFVGAWDFAMLALVRGTIGLLNYTSVGLAPAAIRLMAEAQQCGAEPKPVAAIDPSSSPVLAYETPFTPREDPVRTIYVNALLVAFISLCAGLLLTGLYSALFNVLHVVPSSRLTGTMPVVAALMGVGLMLRLYSEPASALLQVRGQIARDNTLLAGAEIAWILAVTIAFAGGQRGLVTVAAWYAVTGGVLAAMRAVATGEPLVSGAARRALIDRRIAWRLLRFGAMVMTAQLADFLYAPTDYILINRLLMPEDVAVYAPAVQIDVGLFILVGGVAAVLLPRSAVAHAAGDIATVRRYYLRGTLLSAALLALASLGVWLLAPWIFRLWLGSEMRATQALLPLVFIHTVVGGSSAVGRSILLAIGKVRPFTIAVLISGVLNVALSYLFVKYFGWGLRGIVLGTVVAVVGRCVVWMPWYVLNSLGEVRALESDRPTVELPG